MKVVIGDCTLYLGDSREITQDIDFDSVVTDPPYGMAFQSNYRIKKHRGISGDKDSDLLVWACNLPVTHSRYIWMRWDNIPEIAKPKSLITWVKRKHSMGDLKHEHGRKTEVCAFYPGDDHFFPGKRPTDIVTSASSGNKMHPTQKPIDLMRSVVSWTNGVVFDPFMGSGTTLVACAMMGRKGVGVEIDEKYFDIACARVREAYAQGDLFEGVV